MATLLKPPQSLSAIHDKPSLFLAGSIELGLAGPWQARAEARFAQDDVYLLNPRRESWDPAWDLSADHPVFREQVQWELEAQERATLIAMYFAPETRAPITLLELGLFARSGKLVVACPPGFWRRGNVEVVCARYGVPLVGSLEALLQEARARLHLSGP